LDSGRSAPSGSTVSVDVKSLQKALERCDAPALVQALSESLSKATPGTVRMVKELITPLLEADANPKHCVRCHKIYLEAENTRESCVIRCGEPEETNIPDDEYDGHMMRYPCCGELEPEALVEGLDDDDVQECFRTRHTTDQSSVQYYMKYSSQSDRANKEKGIDYRGKNSRIRTCMMMGCWEEESDLDAGELSGSGSGELSSNQTRCRRVLILVIQIIQISLRFFLSTNILFSRVMGSLRSSYQL
jgi:hypothetical protein